jgi:hypothetical protein
MYSTVETTLEATTFDGKNGAPRKSMKTVNAVIPPLPPLPPPPSTRLMGIVRSLERKNAVIPPLPPLPPPPSMRVMGIGGWDHNGAAGIDKPKKKADQQLITSYFGYITQRPPPPLYTVRFSGYLRDYVHMNG